MTQTAAPKDPSYFLKGLLGGLSCTATIPFSNPIDVVKIRTMLQGELSSHSTFSSDRRYKGIFGSLLRIFEEEGVRGLYKGFTPALIREICYSGMRIGGYEPIKDLFGGGNNLPLYQKFIAGAISGAVSSAICNPTDVIKVRMQAEGPLKPGQQRRYRHTGHAFAQIFKDEGLRGLYKGWQPTSLRACLLTAAQLSSYDHCKQVMIRFGVDDGFPLHFGAGALSGFITTVVTCPVDVVKTRFMNQGVNHQGIGQHNVVYLSAFDVFMKTLKSEGILGLFKGFEASYLRLGPSIAGQLVVMEQLRRLSGLSPV
eukprot:TRINITY_DN11519_c0_g1_i2.p1 TRINITY_DN11519_c0_g1~~TRINITY_DN11519_c0_g1_i2.p1  ORF type:complete len:324 (-),score=23.13 TRINITY_DN11519_c0_g1_i2:118-1053(-)